MTTHKCLNKHNMCTKWGLEAYKAWMKYQNTIEKCKKGGGGHGQNFSKTYKQCTLMNNFQFEWVIDTISIH